MNYKKFFKENGDIYLTKWLYDNITYEDLYQIFKERFMDEQQQQVSVEPEVIVKLAEKRINKLYKNRVQYVKDDCDDIVDSIDDEINLLKGLVNGLKYYMGNISKFSE